MSVAESLGSVAALVAWGFALYIFLVAPATLSARLLIAMLIVDGVAVLSSGYSYPFVDRFFSADLGVEFWLRVHVASDWAVIGVYLAFVGATVPAALARPLSGPLARRLALVFSVVAAAMTLPLSPDTYRSVVAPYLYTLIAVVLTWGFAAAVQAWITAKDRGSRARARAFTAAFGVRDTVWIANFLVSAAYGSTFLDEAPELLVLLKPFFYIGPVIVYVPLVAYGMLRTQLFDIDLRIKRTLRRSTVVAAFVAVFFLISGLAELYLSSMLGGILGLVCTSALVFFLDPLQRAAERLSDAAMPRTQDTPEYETFRKLQVFEATLHASMTGGRVPPDKRPVLDALVQSLGIDPAIARRLEEDAMRTHGAQPG